MGAWPLRASSSAIAIAIAIGGGVDICTQLKKGGESERVGRGAKQEPNKGCPTAKAVALPLPVVHLTSFVVLDSVPDAFSSVPPAGPLPSPIPLSP